MKINIHHINEVIEDKLSLFDRGLLITIVLLKDSTSKLTLAKVRASVKFTQEVKESLIRLHESKFIEWSSYSNTKKSIKEAKIDPDIVKAIVFMNDLYKKNFNYNSEATIKGIRERLKEYSLDDIKLVIANRYKEWKDDAVMSKYLNPSTIFRPSKFFKYYEEANRTRKGESLLSIKNINLKNGELITIKKALTFSDNESYGIRIWRLDENGSRLGNGMKANRRGKDIKKSLKIQDSFKEMGTFREFEYTYIEN